MPLTQSVWSRLPQKCKHWKWRKNIWKGQRIASTTSNRKLEQVLPNMLLWLQAGTQKDQNTLEQQDNSIIIAAVHHPCVENSVISKDMTRNYAFSWRAHLNRIEPGEGSWWREEKDSYEFFYGSAQPDIKECGTTLLHFRNTYIEKLDVKKQKCVASTNLPAATIWLYDDNGYMVQVSLITKTFNPQTVD